MTTSKALPSRPSLASLRKQAKKLARDIAAGNADAIARARVQLPNVDLPLSQRNAQLVLAREYGYAGWHDLIAEASKRLGNGLEWAVTQARRAIHDNDVERLKQMLAEYPALLSWHADEDDGGLLGIATGAYGDAGDPEREQWFTRAACAELLIDAGAIVMPSVCESLIESRARGLLQLFQHKGLLPRTLKFRAALGDRDAVRTALDENGNDLAKPSRHCCWIERSRSIPSSADMSMGAGAASPSSSTSSKSDRLHSWTPHRPDRGRRLSWSRSCARSRMAT